MTAQLTPDETATALIAMGVPRDKAIARAHGVQVPAVPVARPEPVALLLPLRFTLPWSALISENRRFLARQNRIFMTPEYKAARAKITEIVRRVMGGAQPLDVPVSLTARVWFPNNRVHDAPNFAGATANALKGVVYVDDRWLYDARWIRAGVDVDSPRAEIEISVCGRGARGTETEER